MLMKKTPNSALSVKLMLPFMDKEQKSLVSTTIVDRLALEAEKEEVKKTKTAKKYGPDSSTLGAKIAKYLKVGAQHASKKPVTKRTSVARKKY